jgi:hypothetical protein
MQLLASDFAADPRSSYGCRTWMFVLYRGCAMITDQVVSALLALSGRQPGL